MKKTFLPLNLQFFAEPEGVEPSAGGASEPPAKSEPSNNGAVSFDYDKLVQIIAGKQSVTEDKVLKGFFEQKGLSQEEMEQAIKSFKEQKAASQPNVDALQQQVALAQQQAQQAQIEKTAFLLAGELGVDLNTMQYLLKLADLSAVMKDGKMEQDKLKEALNKVLEDLPQLKPQADAQARGFRQIGVSGQLTTAQKPTEQAQVPQKRWNRFN